MPAMRQRADRQRRRRRQHAPRRSRRCAGPCRASAGRPCPSARSGPWRTASSSLPHRQRRCRDRGSPARRRRRSTRRRRRGYAGAAPQPDRRRRRSPPVRASGSPCPGTRVSPQRTSPPVKSCFSRLSTARVSTMPRRISRRSSAVSDARDRLARRNPSQASTSSARACSSRLIADVPGVVSSMPSGAGERADTAAWPARGGTPAAAASSAALSRSESACAARPRALRARGSAPADGARPRTLQIDYRDRTVWRDPRTGTCQSDCRPGDFHRGAGSAARFCAPHSTTTAKTDNHSIWLLSVLGTGTRSRRVCRSDLLLAGGRGRGAPTCAGPDCSTHERRVTAANYLTRSSRDRKIGHRHENEQTPCHFPPADRVCRDLRNRPRPKRPRYPRARAAQAVAAHRRPQRLSVGAARARSGPRLRQGRHHRQRAEADDRHPAPAPGRPRRSVLVGLRALDDAGQRGGARDARADRHRASHDAPLAGDVRAGAHRRRRRARLQERQDRLDDRHGGRPLDRQLAGDAADDVRASAPAT